MSLEKPRLTRLTAILTQLQSKKLITAKDIAERHNVSIRTVYRDIRTLESSGIPIITHEGKGYSIMEGFHLAPVSFTQQEAHALITAEQIVVKNKDKSFINQYNSAVQKIKSILRNSDKEKIELLSKRLDVRINPDQESTSNYLIQLQSAIVNLSVTYIEYSSSEKKNTKRKIEPFALIHTQENWVLIAFCRLRKDFRAFRLDRISNISITLEHFDEHDITLDQYFEQKRNEWENTPDIPLS